MVVQHKLMTVEEFWEQYAGKPYELVNGEVVEVMPTTLAHGAVERRLAKPLGNFVDEHKLGEVIVGEVGVRLGAPELRGMDVAFLSNASLARITDLRQFLPFAPDLVVEIVSASNTASEISSKVDLYLKAGSKLVWIVYPDLRKVDVYQASGQFRSVAEGDNLDGADALPGLKIPAGGLFPPPG